MNTHIQNKIKYNKTNQMNTQNPAADFFAICFPFIYLFIFVIISMTFIITFSSVQLTAVIQSKQTKINPFIYIIEDEKTGTHTHNTCSSVSGSDFSQINGKSTHFLGKLSINLI